MSITDGTVPLTATTDNAQLTSLLATLLEPSDSLRDLLVPAVSARIAANGGPPASYGALVDLCAAAAAQWSYEQKADFVSGHPMIGEVKNLSAHSAKEQLGTATRPIVLKRLAHLNALFCTVFPGLRFVTFVAGRPRNVIVTEMEQVIGLPVSPDPLPDSFAAGEPALDSAEVAKLVRPKGSEAWKVECDRAVADVWRIAHARLGNMGLA